MAKNRVQFQKGLSLHTFFDMYGTETQCAETLFKWRCPLGFVCPACGRAEGYSEVKTRGLLPAIPAGARRAGPAGAFGRGERRWTQGSLTDRRRCDDWLAVPLKKARRARSVTVGGYEVSCPSAICGGAMMER